MTYLTGDDFHRNVFATFDSTLDIGLWSSKVNVLTNEQRYKLITTPWKPPIGFIFPCTVQKSQRRYFNAVWLDRYSWMLYSKALSGPLYRICVLFAAEFSGKGGHQRVEHFVTKPCCNYKDFRELFPLISNVNITKLPWN